MKRISLFLAMLCIASAASAALNGTGYYRIMNKTTKRYITIVSSVTGLDRSKQKKQDLTCLQTVEGFDNVASLASSVIYIRKVSGGYDLVGQAFDSYEVLKGRSEIPNPHFSITSGYRCTITGSYAGFDGSLSLSDSKEKNWNRELNANVGHVDTYSGQEMWDIVPVSSSSNTGYFGVKPDIHLGNAHYATLYASFAFKTASPGMTVYTVSQVAYGMAVLKELKGVIPAKTPVIIKCSSSDPSGNKLDIVSSDAESPSGNKLEGDFYGEKNHNASTMRILAVGSDGTLTFVKKSQSKVNANKAYLKVSASTTDELKVVTEQEFNSDDPVTLTAESYTRPYGDKNPAFTYEASGGIVKGIPEITCEATQGSDVGTYPIVISKGSVINSNVKLVNGTLTITKVPLACYASYMTKMAGEENPEFEAWYMGFKYKDNANSLTKQPTFTCAATKDSPEGEYLITPSGAESPNYDITYNQGYLTVVARRLTAENAEREYGDENPYFNYFPTGIVDGDPLVSTTATPHSPAGLYPITISQGTMTNQGVEFVSGTLRVNKAPVDVSIGNYTKKSGQENPEFELIFNGLKFPEDAEKVRASVTITCEATTASAPGEYAIKLEGGENDCYYFRTLTNGKLTVTEADKIVVTANDYTREYGEENPTLGYHTDGFTLTGTPQLSTVAGTNSPAGTYPIVITKGSVQNDNCVYVNGTLTVTKAPVDITIGTYTKKQGEENPQFTPEINGLKKPTDADMLNRLITVTTTATATSAPGEYVITVKLEDNDYYFARTLVNGKLIVTEASEVTIIAKDYTREYGSPNPTFGYTASGTIEGTPTLTCEANATSPVGTYPIVVGTGTVTTNHKFINGTLTIVKAPLLISVADCERKTGEPNPDFTIVYSGWKNNENESVLTKKPVAQTSATPESPAGTYIIRVSGAEAQNYYFNYLTGTLTVTQADDAISDIVVTQDGPADVYSLDGQLVRAKATTLEGLRKGVYLVNGQKVVVK